MDKFKLWLYNRLSEKSTYIGVLMFISSVIGLKAYHDPKVMIDLLIGALGGGAMAAETKKK